MTCFYKQCRLGQEILPGQCECREWVDGVEVRFHGTCHMEWSEENYYLKKAAIAHMPKEIVIPAEEPPVVEKEEKPQLYAVA